MSPFAKVLCVVFLIIGLGVAVSAQMMGRATEDKDSSRPVSMPDFEVAVPEGGAGVVSLNNHVLVITKYRNKVTITQYSKTTTRDGKPEKTVLVLD